MCVSGYVIGLMECMMNDLLYSLVFLYSYSVLLFIYVGMLIPSFGTSQSSPVSHGRHNCDRYRHASSRRSHPHSRQLHNSSPPVLCDASSPNRSFRHPDSGGYSRPHNRERSEDDFHHFSSHSRPACGLCDYNGVWNE